MHRTHRAMGHVAAGIWLAHIMDRIEILNKTKEVSKMEWGIMITTVMLFGMLGLAMFEVTTVPQVRENPRSIVMRARSK